MPQCPKNRMLESVSAQTPQYLIAWKDYSNTYAGNASENEIAFKLYTWTMFEKSKSNETEGKCKRDDENPPQ